MSDLQTTNKYKRREFLSLLWSGCSQSQRITYFSCDEGNELYKVFA